MDTGMLYSLLQYIGFTDKTTLSITSELPIFKKNIDFFDFLYYNEFS